MQVHVENVQVHVCTLSLGLVTEKSTGACVLRSLAYVTEKITVACVLRSLVHTAEKRSGGVCVPSC